MGSGKFDLHSKFLLINSIKQFLIKFKFSALSGLGAGKVFINGKNAVFRVQVLSELVNIIIPHFTHYPLLSTKLIIFTVWAQAVTLFNSGAHKTKDGFMQILSIYAAIGRGVSKTVAEHFPNIQPVLLPQLKLDVEQLEGSWISGYLTVYCTFQAYVNFSGWKDDSRREFKHIFSFSSTYVARYFRTSNSSTYCRTY